MFKKIAQSDFNYNVFNLIDKDWMLITAGDISKYNNMTASWGGMGILWNKPVTYIFIRPTRFTYNFIEQNDYFTICFFEEKYRNILQLSGTKSGNQINKMTELGLTAIKSENNSVYYAESKIVIECKKIYFQDLNKNNFLEKKIINHYPKNDFHRMYVGEITNLLIKN